MGSLFADSGGELLLLLESDLGILGRHKSIDAKEVPSLLSVLLSVHEQRRTEERKREG